VGEEGGAELVDGLDGADGLALAHHRHANERAGDKAGLVIGGAKNAVIFARR
jgi:hypothetical protein